MSKKATHREIEWPEMKREFSYFGFRGDRTISFVPATLRDEGRWSVFWGAWWENDALISTEYVSKAWYDKWPDNSFIDLSAFRWFSIRSPSYENSPFDHDTRPPVVVDNSGGCSVRCDALWSQSTRPATTRSRRKDGVVYFIQGTAIPLIKIGIANNVVSRLYSLQSGSPDELRLLTTQPGGGLVEKTLHDRFSHLRVRGEWFRPEPELIEYIESVKHKGDTTP